MAEASMVIHCPRTRSDMTPCIARDGALALADDICVGCEHTPAWLLKDLATRLASDTCRAQLQVDVTVALAAKVDVRERADKFAAFIKRYVEG